MHTTTDGISQNYIPKIWVGDRESYNAGRLRGEWINLAEERSARSLRNSIDELLREWSASDGRKVESWFVATSENVPFHSENPDLEALMGYVELLERRDSEAVCAFYEVLEDLPDDRADAERRFEDAYFGYFEDVADLGRKLLGQDERAVRSAVQSNARYDPQGATEKALERILSAVDYQSYGRQKARHAFVRHGGHTFLSSQL